MRTILLEQIVQQARLINELKLKFTFDFNCYSTFSF